MQGLHHRPLLEARFGPDHDCPGPKKLEVGFQFMSLLNRSTKKESNTNQIPALSSTKWATAFRNAASTVRASAEAGVAKLSIEISHAWHTARMVQAQAAVMGGRLGWRRNVHKWCSRCMPQISRGFHDPVALVEHVERDHGGGSFDVIKGKAIEKLLPCHLHDDSAGSSFWVFSHMDEVDDKLF
ncbi:hypothetical protein GH714_035959 [Hevea brasiliensis]|uniref:Uncharacterized protein n=1 Tax=Hevea brasiliensis TaxID=3981 RepID=A0A6A6KN75_HEVBR|nr:hypothetical protein GH714_035959 [Hevea brasiliensis]